MKIPKFGLSIACILSCNLSANTLTWAGNGVGTPDDSWEFVVNWSPLSVPSGNDASLIYPVIVAGTYQSTYYPTPPLTFTIASIAITTPNFTTGSPVYVIGGTAQSYVPMSQSGSTITVDAGGDIFLDPVQLHYLQLNAGTNLALNNAAQVLLDHIEGAGMLTVTSQASSSFHETLYLSGPNTYQGGTSIVGGTVFCSTANAFPQSVGSVGFTTSGILDLGGQAQAINQLSTDSSSIIQSTDGNFNPLSATLSFTGSSSIQGNIAGPISLVVGANQSVLLSGSNSFSGTTTINNSGALAIGSPNALGSTSQITLNNSSSLGSAVITANFGASYTLTQPLILTGSNAGGIIRSNSALSLTGNITESGGSNFLSLDGMSQAQAITLSGNNSYTGGTRIQTSTNVHVTTLNSLPSSGPITLADGSALSFTFGSGTQTIGSLASDSTATVALGSVNLTTGSLGSTSYAGTFTGSSGCGLTKVGNGTFTLTGASNYPGPTLLTAGTLAIGNATALGSGSTAIVTMSPNTTLQASSGLTGTLTNPIQLSSTSPQVFNLDSNSLSFPLSGAITEIGGGSNLLSILDSSGTGAGSVILSGVNTYPGGTTIHSGALSINSASNINGTGPGILTLSGGSLSVTGTTSITSPVSILEDSTITTSASQTLQLQGILTGTPGKTLQLPGSGVSSIAAVSVATGSPFTISGVIGGSQNFLKSGPGTLVFPSANSYLGETNLASGTIQLTTPVSALGTGTLTLNNGTILTASADGIVLNNPIILAGSQTVNITSGLTTLNGAFTGGTGLIKLGSGNLKLNGTTNSTSSVAVNGGGLAVVGGMLTSNVTVATGATLSGTGTITGTVINNGNIAPGASIGTLTIVGNYTQADNSIFTNEIDATTSDLLNVQGNVFIGNNTIFNVVVPTGYTYVTKNYPVITTTGFGTISGQHFRRLNIPDPTVGGLLYYTNDVVTLSIFEGSIFPGEMFKGNPGKVEQALNTLFFEGDLSLEEIYLSAIPLTSSQLYNALDYMHPAMYKGMTLAQQNAAVLVQNSLNHRFQNVLDERRCFTCLDQSQKRETFFWGTGFGELLRQSEAYTYDSPQAGYCDDAAGFVGGLDHQFLDTFYVGALGGYSHSHLSWTGDRGKGNINSGYAGLYASAIGDLFYGNLAVTGAWSGFAANRNIIYPGINQTAQNTHHGKQIFSHFDTGLNFAFNKVTVRPFDGLDWIVQQESAYTETGAGPFNLEISSSVANMLRNELGVNFASCGYLRRAKIVADAKLSWVYEARLKGKESDCLFQDTDVPFTVIGYFPTRNLFSVGGSLTTTLLDEFVFCTALKNGEFDHKYAVREDVLTFTLYYNGVFGDKYQDNSFGGQFNLGF